MRSSEQIGAETFVKNNGERITEYYYGIGLGYECLAYRIEQAYERIRSP